MLREPGLDERGRHIVANQGQALKDGRDGNQVIERRSLMAKRLG